MYYSIFDALWECKQLTTLCEAKVASCTTKDIQLAQATLQNGLKRIVRELEAGVKRTNELPGG